MSDSNESKSPSTRRDENSYRSILKATSLFGGVQVFNILVALIRGKLVAMILGPAGMGMNALYLSSTATVQKFSSLGLNLGVVKEIGGAREDKERLARVVATTRKLTLLTALAGAFVCMLLSPVLSETAFGDTSHTLAFTALGIMVFATIASNGESAILQGVHDVRRLSRATVFGSVAGLLLSVPLYYIYGTDGIVPALILLSLAVYLFYLFSARRSVSARPANGTWRLRREDWPLVRQLLAIGLMMMAGDFLSSLGNYLIQAFVRWSGNLGDVGLFQGATSMTTQYAGVVFTALSMDYFPRLCSLVRDNGRMAEAINRQMEIVVALLAPLTGAVIVVAPLLIRLLLTSEFEPASPLLRWLAIGLFFQGILYPMGYVTFAKDNKRVYIWTEVIGSNVMFIVCSLGGYYLWGLVGLGLGALVDKLFWIAVTYIINRRLYGIRLSRKALRGILLSSLSVSMILALSFFDRSPWAIAAMLAILAANLLYAGRRLKEWLSARTTRPAE